MNDLQIRLEQDGRLLGEWRVSDAPLQVHVLDPPSGRHLLTLTLTPAPATAALPREQEPRAGTPVKVEELHSVTLPAGPGSTREQALALVRAEVSPSPPATPPPALSLPAPSPSAPAPMPVEVLLDVEERDVETRTDRVAEDLSSRVPFGEFEDLDTQVVQSPLLLNELEHQREERPTEVSRDESERYEGYDELPVEPSARASTHDDDLSLSEYGAPHETAVRRGPDDDFTLPLPEETAKLDVVPSPDAEPAERGRRRAAEPGRPDPHRPVNAVAAVAGRAMPARVQIARGAEVWFRQGGEWMPRGTMTVRQHVQAFGGMVRCDDQGGLIVLPGSRLNGSATLPTGDALHIEAGSSSVKLPAGSSVILWNGEQGLYVRSNVVLESPSTADAGDGRARAQVSGGHRARAR